MKASENTKQRHTAAKFVPNIRNFEISSKYEGLSLDKSDAKKTIAELKEKYAR